jgi:hypothetical protein
VGASSEVTTKRGGIVRGHACGLAHDAPGLLPGLCSLDEFVVQATTRRRRLALGLGQGDPLARESSRLLEGGRGVAPQDRIAREAQDKSRPAVGSDHGAALGRGKMTLTAHQALGVGPRASQRRQEPAHAHGIFGPSRTGAGTQVGREAGLGGPCKNAEWPRARSLLVMILEGTLLLAIGRLIRVIEVEPKGSGGLCLTGDAVGHKGLREAIEVLAVPLGGQPRAGRGPGSIVGRFPGEPLHPQCEPRGPAQTLGVIGVRIPRSALIDTLGEEVSQRMSHRGLRPLITDRLGQALGQANLPVNPSEQECPAV